MGVSVVLTRPTNRDILEWGIRDNVTDACIPMKIFYGHVVELKDRADYIFIPRMVTVDGQATFCPKYLGLPDMVRFSGEKLPPVIDSPVQQAGTAAASSAQAGVQMAAAVMRVCRIQKAYQQLLLQGLPPLEAVQLLEREPEANTVEQAAPVTGRPEGRLRVALPGYPYVLYDPFISANLYQRLTEMNVEPLTPEQVPDREMCRQSIVLPQN